LSSPSSPRGDCESVKNNLRVYLEKWWQASNETDYNRFGRQAERTYIRMALDCYESEQNAAEAYTKMLAEVMKLPKGAHIRETDAREKAGKGPRITMKKAKPGGSPGLPD